MATRPDLKGADLSMKIELNGGFTEQDVRRALALGYPRSYRVIRIVLPLFLALPALFSLYSPIQLLVSGDMPLEPMLLFVTFLPAIVSLLILGVFVYLLWLQPLRQARRIQSSPLCQGTFRGVATDEILALHNEAAESAVRWDAYVQYKMSDDVVLLYQNNAAFSMVPRSFFASEEDWQRFRQHVQATVPKEQPRAQPVGRWVIYAVIVVIIIVAAVLGLSGTR